jgi:hypothetical protein
MMAVMGLLAWGCGNKGDEPAKPATAAPTAAATSTSAPAKTAAAPTAAEPVKPPAPTAGRSTPPTLEEWNTLKKEVTVKGSSALKCETKIIREYLRVACKGEVDEGTPRGIKVLKGGREAMIFAHKGVMSMILPFVEGTDFEGAFSWTKKSHKLTVKWPKGAKQPVIVGVFEGAASPLDGTARGDADKLCACHIKVTREPTCENLYGAPDPDCDRTYGDDCNRLLACARGEIGPRCLPGFVQFGPAGRCLKGCKSGADCPSGTMCVGSGVPGMDFCVSE